jgi:hypothetical protein
MTKYEAMIDDLTFFNKRDKQSNVHKHSLFVLLFDLLMIDDND